MRGKWSELAQKSARTLSRCHVNTPYMQTTEAISYVHYRGEKMTDVRNVWNWTTLDQTTRALRRGGSRVVQVICTNHSNFFQILFLSSLLLLTKSITFLVLLFIMKLTKQLRDYSVDHTANPAPPERSGRVTVRAVSSFVDLSRTTRKKFRRHDRTKFLPRG